MQRLIKIPQVLHLYPKSKAALYGDIQDNLFPKGINIGARSVGYIESEVEAVIEARIQGQSDDEIRKLVLQLQSDRFKGGLK